MRTLLIALLLTPAACYASHEAGGGPPPDTRPPPAPDAVPPPPGDVGPPDTPPPPPPPPPPVGGPALRLSNSGAFLLMPDGGFYSAGDVTEGVAGRWGQLGFPRTPATEYGFVRYEGPHRFTDIAPAQLATCGALFDASGSVSCWGRNAFGLLGTGGTDPDRVELEPVAASLVRVSILEAGDSHVCALDYERFLLCWGSNAQGQLGLAGAASFVAFPTFVAYKMQWSAVSSSYEHTCAIRSDGALFCWGRGDDGQLGIGSTESSTTPARVGAERDWRRISAGVGHTCGIRGAESPGGHMFCWGRNVGGEIGAPIGTSAMEPREVGGSGWRWVSAGEFHTCALRDEDDVLRAYCFGDNTSGELGLPGVRNSGAPLRIATPERWTSITASWRYTCGIAGERPYCWGNPLWSRFHAPSTPMGTVDVPTEVVLTPTPEP